MMNQLICFSNCRQVVHKCFLGEMGNSGATNTVRPSATRCTSLEAMVTVRLCVVLNQKAHVNLAVVTGKPKVDEVGPMRGLVFTDHTIVCIIV